MNHMGLFTFYLQQMRSQSPKTSNNVSEEQKNPSQIFLQLAQPSQEELEDESASEISPKRNVKFNKENESSPKRQAKIKEEREAKRKVLSQVRNSEYSNTQILKNHLKDLTTLKDIVDKTKTHSSVPERHRTQKSTHKQTLFRGNDLNRGLDEIAKQLQSQVDKLRNNKKVSVRNNLITLVAPSSVYPLKKKGRNRRLPTLKKPFKELRRDKTIDLVEQNKKIVERKWKNPHKEKKQPYLQPIFSDRNQQYNLKIEEISRRSPEKKYQRL